MAELGQEEQLLPETKECVGPIIFTGDIYHGTAGPFEFSGKPEELLLRQDIDYSGMFINDQFDLPDIEASTLGYGLYTTDNMSEAQKYAGLRKHVDKPAYVHTLSLEECPLYDFRRKGDLAVNGVVSLDLAQVWSTYFKEHKGEIEAWFRRRNPKGGVSFANAMRHLTTYEEYLNHFIGMVCKGKSWQPSVREAEHFGLAKAASRQLGLRDMLRTGYGDVHDNAPLHGGLWARFVKDTLKCDGVIYNESGDTKDFTNSATFALYTFGHVKGQTISPIR